MKKEKEHDGIETVREEKAVAEEGASFLGKSTLFTKKDVLLIKPIEVNHKKGSIILPDEKERAKLYLDDFDDHPLQGEVMYIGNDMKEYFFNGIEVGDIVYYDRPLNTDRELVNIKGSILGRLAIGNVFMVCKTVNKITNKNIN